MILNTNGKSFNLALSKYEITSGYLANEPFRNHLHYGIDLKMKVGTSIYSPVKGIISKVADYGDKSSGKTLFIETQDHQTVILGHLSKINAKEGDIIGLGEKIAESGNTGEVIGNGHLHIGLKDANGHFIDPKHIEQSFQKIAERMNVGDTSVLHSLNPFHDMTDYIHALRTDGFFMATFDKTPGEFFFGWIGDALKSGLEFVLINDEAFFIFPALTLMVLTFLVGTNKGTKWIVPLWFAYFVSSVVTQATGLMEWLAK